MKIKVKSEEELLFQNKITFEIYNVPEKGVVSQESMNAKIKHIAGRELNVDVHKFSPEAYDVLGYTYIWEMDTIPKHYMFITPYEVEKIIEY